jgi:nitroreductase
MRRRVQESPRAEGRTIVDLATVDHLLTSTRSVRKRLDLQRAVPLDVVERCLEIAMQAPTGSNAQGWHFLVVTDAEKRAGLAALYKKAFDAYLKMNIRPQYGEGDPRAAQRPRVIDSATYLGEHLHEVPVHIVACVEGRVEQGGVIAQASTYGSILPAVWSLMLALRSRGLGSAWTTLHLVFEREAAAILGIPDTVTQAVLVPVAYYTGDDFKPAHRLPARDRIHWEGWEATRPARPPAAR